MCIRDRNKTDQQFGAMIASYKALGNKASTAPKEEAPAPAPAPAPAEGPATGGFFKKDGALTPEVELFVKEIVDAMSSQGFDPSVDAVKKSSERGGMWDDFADWYLSKMKKTAAGNQFSRLSTEALTEKATQYLQLSRASETNTALAKMLKKAQGGQSPRSPRSPTSPKKGGKGGGKGKAPPSGGPGLSEEKRKAMEVKPESIPAARPVMKFGADELKNVKLKKSVKKPKEAAPAPAPAQPAAAKYTDDMAAADEARKAKEKAEMQADLDAMKAKQQQDLLGDTQSNASTKREKMKTMSDEELIADSLGMSVEEYRVQFLGEAASPEPEKELSIGEQKFRELDTGNKGYLTWQDLQAFSKWLYASVTGGKELSASDLEREAKKVAEKLDTDEDGKVQLDEFAPFYENRKAQMDKAAARRAGK
eukprot:TRINITY_DN3610_c0_g3_i1.p1 TRINITY_DN3610_c0_g3~~TRINITY_DN3610_c0_g3_i1.p1  ORF type:complete len:422 (-),score=162.85 TRINITY_DN3610_c0_g3_i1:91-1356(-)